MYNFYTCVKLKIVFQSNRCIKSFLTVLIVHNNPELFIEEIAEIVMDFTLVRLNESFTIEKPNNLRLDCSQSPMFPWDRRCRSLCPTSRHLGLLIWAKLGRVQYARGKGWGGGKFYFLRPSSLPTGILYTPQFRSHEETKMAVRRTQRSTSTISWKNRGLWTVNFKALAKNYNTSAIADHVKATRRNIKWDHFDVLAKGKTDYRCKVKEILFIQDLEPAFNVNVGGEKLLLY